MLPKLNLSMQKRPADHNILLAWRVGSKTCFASTQTMPQTQAKAPGMGALLRRVLLRLAMIAAVASLFIWIVQRSSERLDRNTEPAGFARGALHGAMMPLALPNLLIGRDVTI
jgi:hypothetical protein